MKLTNVDEVERAFFVRVEKAKEQEAKEQPAEQSTEELPEIDVSADLLQ